MELARKPITCSVRVPALRQKAVTFMPRPARRQIAHDRLSLPAARIFMTEKPWNGPWQRPVPGPRYHPQHAQVMAVDDGQIIILIQDLDELRVVIDQMVQRQAQCLQAVKIVASSSTISAASSAWPSAKPMPMKACGTEPATR